MSGFSDILGSIGTGIASFAPTLATMLGGPLAGVAVGELEKVLGLAPASNSDMGSRAQSIADVLAQGKLTAEQIAAIKIAELKHAEIIGQQGIDLAKLNADHQEAGWNADVKDRDSARTRQVALKDQTPAILAYLIIGGFFIILIGQLVALIAFPEAVAAIPSAGWNLIGNLSGYLTAEAKAATAFFFGSSSGSRDKDATIKAQAEAGQ